MESGQRAIDYAITSNSLVYLPQGCAFAPLWVRTGMLRTCGLGVACSEHGQPCVNNASACSRAVSCVTILR